MTDRYDAIFKSGNVAVITGGANGIGFALAQRCAAVGMRVCIADFDSGRLLQAEHELTALCANGADDVLAMTVNVSNLEDVEGLKEKVYQRFGRVDLLVNNAGIGAMSKSWGDVQSWRRILDVNLDGVIHGVQVFAGAMVDQGTPAMIVNTGSKQGITCPPGSPAYNVSKTAVKALTESLAHDLRNAEGDVSAHLLVPGFVYSNMIKKFIPEKPEFAWTCEQTVDYFLGRLKQQDFYIVCPDGEVTEDMDRKRVLWGARDIVDNRPALSRWHPDYQDAFAAYMDTPLD